MSKRRVVVTGLGAVTPVGNNVQAFWESVKTGKVGIGEITRFDTADFKVKLAAEVKDFNAKDYMDFKSAKRMELFSQYAVAAAKEAMADAGIEMGKEDQEDKLMEMDADCICHTISGKPIKPKTLGQKAYVDAIRKNMIVFGLGPAGTGKTYLAMAMAITAFKNNEVSRIILTRPAIEAGEKLGFLPGDLQSKVDPYLRPLYDALYQIMGAESFAKNMEKGLIEVAPLAYMRGRTLDNAYIILDEAQNTTPAQMKMFLTRIGFGSKVIVTGDSSQKDLPVGAKSGLDVATRVLKNIDDIAFCNLTNKDVVRHPLVQKIVKAYDDYEAGNKRSPKLKHTDKGKR